MAETMRIATRRSPLALWQARHVAEALRRAHPDIDCELLPMRSEGDRLLDAPLAKIGGKGLFVKELENALLDGRADIAVHSMKDVPVALPAGLTLAVMMPRADPRDALVGEVESLAALPTGARVGTSSLRRQCQLRAYRPDLELVGLRGGVHTRLAKLDAGDFDAIILAAAGLDRMQHAERIAERIDPEIMLPAIGQGVMGIECREDDTATHERLLVLADEHSTVSVAAERAMNAALDGGCQVPIAGHATLARGRLGLVGRVVSLDGRQVVESRGEDAVEGAERLGARIADELMAGGAASILEAVYASAG